MSSVIGILHNIYFQSEISIDFIRFVLFRSDIMRHGPDFHLGRTHKCEKYGNNIILVIGINLSSPQNMKIF